MTIEKAYRHLTEKYPDLDLEIVENEIKLPTQSGTKGRIRLKQSDNQDIWPNGWFLSLHIRREDSSGLAWPNKDLESLEYAINKSIQNGDIFLSNQLKLKL